MFFISSIQSMHGGEQNLSSQNQQYENRHSERKAELKKKKKEYWPQLLKEKRIENWVWNEYEINYNMNVVLFNFVELLGKGVVVRLGRPV